MRSCLEGGVATTYGKRLPAAPLRATNPTVHELSTVAENEHHFVRFPLLPMDLTSAMKLEMVACFWSLRCAESD